MKSCWPFKSTRPEMVPPVELQTGRIEHYILVSLITLIYPQIFIPKTVKASYGHKKGLPPLLTGESDRQLVLLKVNSILKSMRWRYSLTLRGISITLNSILLLYDQIRSWCMAEGKITGALRKMSSGALSQWPENGCRECLQSKALLISLCLVHVLT